MDSTAGIIQTLSKMIFRAAVIGLLILSFDQSAVWALPFSVILAIGSEAKALTERKKQMPKGEPEWMGIWNSESDSSYWEIWNDTAEKTIILHYVPDEDYSEKDTKIAMTYDEFADLITFLKRLSKVK